MKRATTVEFIAWFAFFFVGLSAAAAQSPSAGLPSQAQSVVNETTVTPSAAQHAVEDAKAAMTIVEHAPKEERQAAADRISKSLIADPKVTSYLKNQIINDPQNILKIDPETLTPGDKISLGRNTQNQVVDPSLVPIAALPGGLQVIASQNTDDSLIKAVMGHSADLTTAAKSVGRIEVQESDGSLRLIGTAFVVAKGIVMTACHVAKTVAHYDDAVNLWQLNAATYIDFGATTQHLPSLEYEVRGIARVSTTRGLDIALIQVAETSRNGSTALPAPLTLSQKQVTQQIPVAVIGFPDLNYLVGTPDTLKVISELRHIAPDDAKYVSPGQILSNEPRTTFHVLVHVGSTHAGNSGSPVFSLDPVEVIGIHYCCTGVDGTSVSAKPVDDAGCSSTADADIHSNEAISAPDALALMPVVSVLIFDLSRCESTLAMNEMHNEVSHNR